jgi:HEAT repeats
MRPKIVIGVIVLGLFAVVSALLFSQRGGPPTETQPSETVSGQTATIDASTPGETVSAEKKADTRASLAATNSTSDADAAMADTPEEKQAAFVVARVGELMDLGMNDDIDSLNTLLSELTNRDPEIRKAALEAVKQFGSQDAIPKLVDAASQTDDPYERVAIADAIEFLKLPSLTEVIHQNDSALRGGTKGAP